MTTTATESSRRATSYFSRCDSRVEIHERRRTRRARFTAFSCIRTRAVVFFLERFTGAHGLAQLTVVSIGLPIGAADWTEAVIRTQRARERRAVDLHQSIRRGERGRRTGNVFPKVVARDVHALALGEHERALVVVGVSIRAAHWIEGFGTRSGLAREALISGLYCQVFDFAFAKMEIALAVARLSIRAADWVVRSRARDGRTRSRAILASGEASRKCKCQCGR